MFAIDADAAEYIRQRAGAVVIRLMFVPGVGLGCACSPKRVAGRYAPFIALGRPRRSEQKNFRKLQVETGSPANSGSLGCSGIDVYFHYRLAVEEGFDRIHITLHRFLFFRSLKVEGARQIAYLDFVESPPSARQLEGESLV